MRPPTHYDTLEISTQASPEVVRAAYRSLIQRFHPDRRPGDAQVAARAAAITSAYEVLSDPQRRAAYDQALAAERAAEAPPASQAPRSRGAGQAAGPGLRERAAPKRPVESRSWAAGWPWAVLLVAVIGIVAWLALARLEPPADRQADPQAELTAIRMAFAADGQPEEQRVALHSRKQALVKLYPELQARVLAEAAQDRRTRTLDLFEGPLVVKLGRATLKIPRLQVVLGTVDTAALRAQLVQQEHRLSGEVTSSLQRADPTQLSGPQADGYLKAIVLGALSGDFAKRAREQHPPTYFESPGRYGVVEVLLPEGFELVPD